MSILKTIHDDLKIAMREKNRDVLLTLRSLKAAITNFEKIGKGEVDDNIIIDIVKKQIKQRMDSIESFSSANRQDLVDQEQTELNILVKYIPEQMCVSDVTEQVLIIIESLGASSIKDMGKVMATCKNAFDGKADNSLIAKIIKEKLSDLCS